MSNRTPSGFYGAAGRPTRRGRRLTPMAGPPRVAQEQENQVYQPNEGIFEREEYQLNMNPSDSDELDDAADFGSRNSITATHSRQQFSVEAHTPRQDCSPLSVSPSSFSPSIVAL